MGSIAVLAILEAAANYAWCLVVEHAMVAVIMAVAGLATVATVAASRLRSLMPIACVRILVVLLFGLIQIEDRGAREYICLQGVSVSAPLCFRKEWC